MLSELNEQTVEQVEQVAVEAPVESTAQESSKEHNFRMLRERAERAESRLREMETYLVSQQQKPAKVESDDEDIPLEDDSYVEAKYIKRLKKDLVETKKQLQALNVNTAQTVAEAKLRAKFGEEFDRYLTAENIQKLKELKPAHYRSIMSNPDIYDQGEAAIDSIKAFIAKEKYQDVDKRIEENKQKPRSGAAAASQTADTPLSRVGDYDRRILTEERKEQLRRQVAAAKMFR